MLRKIITPKNVDNDRYSRNNNNDTDINDDNKQENNNK